MGVSGISSTSERGLSMPVAGATRSGVTNVVVSDVLVAGTVAGTWAHGRIVGSRHGRGVPGGWEVVASTGRPGAGNAE